MKALGDAVVRVNRHMRTISAVHSVRNFQASESRRSFTALPPTLMFRGNRFVVGKVSDSTSFDLPRKKQKSCGILPQLEI
jgi:hypothetical protein